MKKVEKAIRKLCPMVKVVIGTIVLFLWGIGERCRNSQKFTYLTIGVISIVATLLGIVVNTMESLKVALYIQMFLVIPLVLNWVFHPVKDT